MNSASGLDLEKKRMWPPLSDSGAGPYSMLSNIEATDGDVVFFPVSIYSTNQTTIWNFSGQNSFLTYSLWYNLFYVNLPLSERS